MSGVWDVAEVREYVADVEAEVARLRKALAQAIRERDHARALAMRAASERDESIRERDEALSLAARFQVSTFSERERSRRLVEALRGLAARWQANRGRWSTRPSGRCPHAKALADALAEYAEPRPAEPWQRKPVTHEWTYAQQRVHSPTAGRLLNVGWTVHPWVNGAGFPATRPVRGEP